MLTTIRIAIAIVVGYVIACWPVCFQHACSHIKGACFKVFVNPNESL